MAYPGIYNIAVIYLKEICGLCTMAYPGICAGKGQVQIFQTEILQQAYHKNLREKCYSGPGV